ncbi:MAG: NAD(P)H-hydrate dehydratase [Flavobacterium sp.]|nr:NAD(P)H-hydrate dehydratase [Flavobacterium sp.]
MNPIAVTRQEILSRFHPVDPKTHKGLQGHVLLIGGSYGKIGAISLSSKAALRTGCGLVTVFIPKCGYTVIQTANPEIMVLTDVEENCITNIDFSIKPQAIGIGPGMGLDFKTQKTFHSFLKVNQIPLVIDADALNSLSHNAASCYLLQAKTILTPHQKELERLIGNWSSEEEKLGKAIDFSLKFNVVLVLKGAPTIIVDGETLYENTTGNAALATAGSGDVLTGIITSLLAQSYPAVDAAMIGVYLHGLCADLRDENSSTQSFIASDIIENLGKAFLSLGN